MQLREIRFTAQYKDRIAWLDNIIFPNEKEFMFKKLLKAEKYKQSNWDITFAPQNAKCYGHIDSSAKKLLESKEIADDGKDKKKRIYLRWENIKDLDLNILKRCQDIKHMFWHSVEIISYCKELNRVESQKFLEQAQTTLHYLKFSIQVERTWQV